MVFCNGIETVIKGRDNVVTILILVDGFLQLEKETFLQQLVQSHNPYFSRWFSAIVKNSGLAIHYQVSQSLF